MHYSSLTSREFSPRFAFIYFDPIAGELLSTTNSTVLLLTSIKLSLNERDEEKGDAPRWVSFSFLFRDRARAERRRVDRESIVTRDI